jgi:hypothetical protein
VVSESTLIEALANDLVGTRDDTANGAQPSVVLVLDLERQFKRLIPDLSVELESRDVALEILDGLDGQFAIKMALLRHEAAGKKAVVYAPSMGPEALNPGPGGSPPDVWALVEYRYKGRFWDGSPGGALGDLPTVARLDRWLERHGVTFQQGSSRSKLVSGGSDSKLARFSARRGRRRLDTWPRPLTESAVRDELAGEPRDSVVQLLLDPSAASSDWGDDREDVLERLGVTYGFRLDGTDPDLIADEIAVAIAVTDAWDVFDRRDDFPFLARLPRGSQQRERVLALFRGDLIHRSDVLVRFRARISRLEPELGAIEGWANDKPGVPAALPHLLGVRIRRLLDRLEEAWSAGPAACVDLLDRDLTTAGLPIDAHRSLGVLHDVRRLSQLARDSEAASESLQEAAGLVDAYATKWWTVDALYLSVSAACRDEPDLAIASALASRLYFNYLEAVNERFSQAVEPLATWPPAGTRGIADAAAKVWAPSPSRQAVLIVDALRFDLGQQVTSGLGPGATLEPVVSTLPTTTPFGMTALMPLNPGEPSVSYSGELSIAAGAHTDLQTRAGRKAYLESFFAARDPRETVAFVELEAIVQGVAIPKARWLVVFSYALDDRGHSLADAASLPEEAGRLVPRLVRAIERLHRAGVARVDVVTDHGFIFVPPELTDSLGHPDLPARQAVSKNPRYAVLQPEAAATEVIHRTSPLASNVSLGFPRGTRTLSKATVYLHGGISLQECVIPRITSQASMAASRVEVEVEVTVSKVTGATIPVRLRPAAGPASGQMTLAAPRPTKVRISVEADVAGNVSEVADAVGLEVRADTPELTSALYLREGVRLVAGTVLTVRAQDAETGEALFATQVPLVAAWEG